MTNEQLKNIKKEKQFNGRTNFYDLSFKTGIPTEKLFSLYQELFPHIRLYSYDIFLQENEIEELLADITNS